MAQETSVHIFQTPSVHSFLTLNTFKAYCCSNHTHSFPNWETSGNNIFKYDPHSTYWSRTQTPWGLFTPTLAYLKEKHFAESQLAVHKDLSKTSQSVIHALNNWPWFFQHALWTMPAPVVASKQIQKVYVTDMQRKQSYRHGKNQMGFEMFQQ